MLSSTERQFWANCLGYIPHIVCIREGVCLGDHAREKRDKAFWGAFYGFIDG